MINISKSGNAIKFAFTDSDHYLYGNGEIEVPVNSLSLIVDESNMVTFRKANSNDIFLSFNPANSNLSDKAGVINFYKTNMVGSTGGGGSESGITSGEVQTMIDNSLDDYYDKDEVDTAFETVNASLSGKADTSYVNAALGDKADTSAVTAVANDVSTLSGQVATKVNTTDFSAYSAATDARIAEDEEVTAAALNDLDERIGDPYQKVSGITIDTNNEGDFPFIELKKELEDGNTDYTHINDAGIDSAFENNSDGSIYGSGFGQGSIGNYATDFPDENVTSERNFNITTDGFEQTTFENVDDGESQYTRYSSDNEFNYGNGLILSQQWYDEKNDTTTNSNISIINNKEGATFIELTDHNERTVSIAPNMLSWDDGRDSGGIEWSNIATNTYVDAALSGKADTSAVTAVNDALTAHTSDTGIHVSAQEKNAWNAKAEPYSAGTGIDITDNVISVTGGGGGATYSAGTNISIDTANTINCTLPITANTATSSTFIAGNPSSVVDENILIGSTSLFRSNYKNNVVIGNVGTKASQDCVVIGRNATGGTNNNYDWYNVAIGSLANANGGYHVAIGYNVQATGTTKMNLNDQIKVDTNNQVYIKDKTNTTDVCIQDAIAALGGLKLLQCTQAEYDALVSGGTVDSSTIYFITNVVS